MFVSDPGGTQEPPGEERWKPNKPQNKLALAAATPPAPIHVTVPTWEDKTLSDPI